jgi:hypothetical protein
MVGGSVGLLIFLENTIEKVVTVPMMKSTNITILSLQCLEIQLSLVGFPFPGSSKDCDVRLPCHLRR